MPPAAYSNNDNSNNGNVPDDGPALLQQIRTMAESVMQSNAAQIMQDPDLQRPAHELRQILREKLRTHGTDVELNDRDSLGDGDQSPIHLDDSGKQVYRDMFASGGDISADATDFFARTDKPPQKLFLYLCVQGQYDMAKHVLETLDANVQARQGAMDPAIRVMLNYRVTSMRLTPLLAIVSLGKGLGGGSAAQLQALHDNQIKIARLLLLYGARPDARDVCGKTVCHYGAGIMATPMTMEVVRMCSAAHQSSHLFGQEVVLQGLQNTELNGNRGMVRGYVVHSARRVVYLYDDEKEMAVKPENLALADGSTTVEPPRKLCDLQDRLGGTCLLEVFMSNRVEIGKFLLDELGADPSVADLDGYSPEMMSMTPLSQMASGIGPMVMQAAMKRKKAELIAKMNVCAKCQATGTSEQPLKNCAKCSLVAYCSRECQVAHWKDSHKHECKTLAEEIKRCIVLEKPPHSSLHHRVVSHKTGKVSDGTYRKPKNVSVDEIFHVKIQAGGMHGPLLLYDKTRQCEFSVQPTQRGYEEIKQIILAETATRGTKTYMAASFDVQGNLRVYPKQTFLRTW